MQPWYKVVTPRKEVRQGRSFNPNEFAIALEQVVAKTAPEDYRNPNQFFSRTCFTRALCEHTGMVLRRLSGETENTAPVLTLVTQFGGGKTHTLTTLYHLAKNGDKALQFDGISELMKESRLKNVPKAKAAVFVGNAWDPQEGKETPWIDIARQIGGDKGVEILGPKTKESPPGTETLSRLFESAGGTVLILFDEVLNFINRHRKMADSFHAFIQNLTVAMTGTERCAAVISLPRSQVEMTDWDMQWQSKITKVVKRVAKDLFANDESEISKVIRRRLFEDLGNERVRKKVTKAFADWCFERRSTLPPEWTAVDSSTTEAKSKEFLQSRFDSCYPFHPATLSVFQRKWQTLPQYQQTRGTLAMLAQWISWAYREGFQKARKEPLITLGSAPLRVPNFRSTVLGQLGEDRLAAAIETDIAGERAHANVLDMDTKGPLSGIHHRVGAAIFFESSGGQIDRVAHLPELRFALGEPGLDTTSIDTAAYALESKSFFISRVGSDGFKVYHKATIRKAVSDRRASLDEETEVKPTMQKFIKDEFNRGKTIQITYFPENSEAVLDSPKLNLVVVDSSIEWSRNESLHEMIVNWTYQRSSSTRLYPAAIIWCFKKPGHDLRGKVELLLAWKRIAKDVRDGVLGTEYDKADLVEIDASVKDSEQAAVDEVWAGYRYLMLADAKGPDKLRKDPIDLGAGHSSSGETLCGRVLTALKSEALLNETVGAGYIERKWPEALKEQGAWPLSGLRQSFLNGTLTRLIDPDKVLKTKIPEFVEKRDFGLASGCKPDGTYNRIWFDEFVSVDEVEFDSDVYLLTKEKANSLKARSTQPIPEPMPEPEPEPGPETGEETGPTQVPGDETTTLLISGTIPPELWNRLGTKIIPKLRGCEDIRVGVDFSVTVSSNVAKNTMAEIQQIIDDLDLRGKVSVRKH